MGFSEQNSRNVIEVGGREFIVPSIPSLVPDNGIYNYSSTSNCTGMVGPARTHFESAE